MQLRTGRSGWGGWLSGLVLMLAVALSPGLSLGQLVVDGGGTVNIPPPGSYTTEDVGSSSAGTIDQSSSTNTVTGTLTLGTTSTGSGTYILSGGALSAGYEPIGLNGIGIFTQSGGTNSTTGDVALGRDSGSSGTYELNGGSLSVGGNEYSGSHGSGSFSNSGGTNTVAGSLTVGNASGSTGTYTLSDAGSLSLSGDENIGYSGSGAFTQTGGTNAVSGDLYLGNNSGARGSYNLSAGLLDPADEYVGYSGTASITQSGGTNTVTGDLYLGLVSTGNGTYNLSDSGSGSSFSVGGSEYIGFDGSGAFTQSGGTHTVSGDLNLGYNSGASGTYSLSGTGSLSVAGSEYIGYAGTGAFTQGGGSNSVTTDLILGYTDGSGNNGSGSYNLSGGSLAVSGNETIGSVGSGSFTQTGGTNTVTGALNLAASSGASGSYSLSGGSLAAGTVNLNAGGSFTMTGGTLTATTFNGNLTNGGTVKSGDAPGTMTVNGNYTQTASGTLVEQIASASSYSKLVVTGSASLNGALNIQLLGGFLPTYGQSFTGILTASGVSGQFSSIINKYITPTLYWQVLYVDPLEEPTSVNLQVNGATVARNYTSPSLNLTHNQWAVGNMLNGVANVTSGDLNTVLNAIDSLTSNGAVANAYQQISPEKAAALSTLAFAGANLQKSVLSRRITDIRFGPEDASLAAGGPGSFNLNYGQGEGVMVASTATSLTGLLSGQKDTGATERPWGVYFDPGLIIGGQGSTVDQTGFGFTMAGFTAGADYRLQQDLLLGLNTGYTYTGAGFHGSGGSVQGNTWPLNAYAAYLPKPFYAYGSLGYALNLFNLERDFNFGGLSRAASSSSTGNQLNGYGEMGYDLRLHPVVLTPAVNLSYSKLWLNGFTETGAGALDLTVNPQNAQSLQTGVGGKITVPLQRDSVTVTPQAYAFYQHECSDSSRIIDARLSQGGGSFNYLTDDFSGAPHRNFAVVGADVTIASKKNLKVQLDYNAEVGRGNYTAHYVSAGVRWEF